MKANIVQQIINSQKKMNDIILTTPLEFNNRLSSIYNNNIYIKREDLQIVRSFKIRGAYNNILNLDNKKLNNGIVCASAGNHAQGVAYVSQKKKIQSNIFLPLSTPIQKINRIKYFSNDISNINLVGNNFDETLKKAFEFCDINNKVFIHPYDNINTIIGQGTIAKEIYDQLFKPPDMIFSCIGGGGLISGLSLFSKNTSKSIKIIGVEPELCASMYESIKADKIIELLESDNFVDGAAVKKPGHLTFNICKEYVDDIVTVSNGRICKELLDLYQDDGIISEPAGALSISGLDYLKKNNIYGKNIVCILSGGNNDITRYPDIIDKFLTFQDLKHYYIIKFAQKPGVLKNFITKILGKDDDIIRFEYIKKTNVNYGNVLVGIEVSKPFNIYEINSRLEKYDFDYTKISEKDLIYKYIV